MCDKLTITRLVMNDSKEMHIWTQLHGEMTSNLLS